MIFYLGPLGGLVELPPIERDQKVDANASAPTATFVALEGQRSQDRMGPHRRTWVLPWVYLTADELDELDALRRGLLGWPLYVLDPNRPNLAPTQIASAGTERRSAKGWEVASGSRRWVPLDAPPPGIRSVGAIAWSRQTSADELSVGRTLPRQRTPVPPLGGPISVVAVARRRTPDAVMVAAGFDGWTKTGTLVQSFAAPVAVGAGWGDLAHAWTPPPEVVSFAPAWRVAAGQPASTVEIAAVRYGHGPTAPPHTTGGGAAIVTVEDMPESYPSAGEWDVAITLAEA